MGMVEYHVFNSTTNYRLQSKHQNIVLVVVVGFGTRFSFFPTFRFVYFIFIFCSLSFAVFSFIVCITFYKQTNRSIKSNDVKLRTFYPHIYICIFGVQKFNH